MQKFLNFKTYFIFFWHSLEIGPARVDSGTRFQLSDILGPIFFSIALCSTSECRQGVVKIACFSDCRTKSQMKRIFQFHKIDLFWVFADCSAQRFFIKLLKFSDNFCYFGVLYAKPDWLSDWFKTNKVFQTQMLSDKNGLEVIYNSLLYSPTIGGVAIADRDCVFVVVENSL